MTRLACPFCGPRELPEFSFHTMVPEPGDDEFARVYLRLNRADRSIEFWQHDGGCRMWLRVTRNPSSGEVLDVRAAREDGGAA